MHRTATLLGLMLLVALATGCDTKKVEKEATDAAAVPQANADAAAAAPGEASKTVTFGVIPIKNKDTNTSTEVVEAFAQLLSAQIPDTQVKVNIVESYEALISALEAGSVDFALMDAGAGWLSYKKAKAEAVLAEVSEPEDAPFYRAVAFVNAKLTEGPWDHDGDASTPEKAPLCHLAQTKGRISAHTSLTGSAGMIMPLGFMLQEGLVSAEAVANQNDTSEIDGLLAQWFTEGYILGKGGAGGTHDITGKLSANHRDIHSNHYANAFYHAYLGNADVAFVSESTPTQKFPEKEHSWTTTEMTTIQVRGDYPKTEDGAPDCEKILAEDYREAHPERFTFGKVAAHPVMVGAHVDDATRDAFVKGMLAINDASANAPLNAAWKALYGKAGVVEIETLDHLKDIGERIEIIPGIRTKVETKKKL